MEIKSTNVKRVSVYESIYTLFRFEIAHFEAMEPDFLDYVSCINDFEPITYISLNDGETVLLTDSINGDVLGVQTIQEMYSEAREFYDREENT